MKHTLSSVYFLFIFSSHRDSTFVTMVNFYRMKMDAHLRLLSIPCFGCLVYMFTDELYYKQLQIYKELRDTQNSVIDRNKLVQENPACVPTELLVLNEILTENDIQRIERLREELIEVFLERKRRNAEKEEQRRQKREQKKQQQEEDRLRNKEIRRQKREERLQREQQQQLPRSFPPTKNASPSAPRSSFRSYSTSPSTSQSHASTSYAPTKNVNPSAPFHPMHPSSFPASFAATKEIEASAPVYEQEKGSAMTPHVKVEVGPIVKSEPCTICLVDVRNMGVTTECGHVFHEQCLDQYFAFSDRCPNCRTALR